jgi:hypothetical protein
MMIYVSLRQRSIGKKPDAPPRFRKDTLQLPFTFLAAPHANHIPVIIESDP